MPDVKMKWVRGSEHADIRQHTPVDCTHSHLWASFAQVVTRVDGKVCPEGLYYLALIEAVPDMLEVLEALSQWFCDGGLGVSRDTMYDNDLTFQQKVEQIRRTIRKRTGSWHGFNCKKAKHRKEEAHFHGDLYDGAFRKPGDERNRCGRCHALLQEPEAINLDGMDYDDLRELLEKTVEDMFPGAPLAEARRAHSLYRQYIRNKMEAIRARLEGNIQRALDREELCERIYKQLPEFSRW